MSPPRPPKNYVALTVRERLSVITRDITHNLRSQHSRGQTLMLGSTEGRLGVDYPFAVTEGCQVAGESGWIAEASNASDTALVAGLPPPASPSLLASAR